MQKNVERHNSQIAEVGRHRRCVGVGALFHVGPSSRESARMPKYLLRRRVQAHTCILFESVPYLKEVLGEHVLVDGLAIDSDPFTNGYHVRRSVQASACIRGQSAENRIREC